MLPCKIEISKLICSGIIGSKKKVRLSGESKSLYSLKTAKRTFFGVMAVYNSSNCSTIFGVRQTDDGSFLVGEQVMIFYESQPRTCRRCGGEGHVANGCKAPRCFNCDGAGHRADDCPKPGLCNVCFSEEHFTCRCPFIIFSANVQPRAEGQGTASYAATVQDRPPGKQPPKPAEKKRQEVRKP